MTRRKPFQSKLFNYLWRNKNLQSQKKPTILFIIQSMAGEFCFELILLFAGLRN